ncbi:MAG: hypothetical protein PHH49_08035 [Candidatus Omnitrophica bacterium]|nr:hypothetical protein [Candidatus Omnitrophota bacterium]MDD5488887.1 hypothetical protein [Candidatus Omnitrophota bacterium]
MVFIVKVVAILITLYGGLIVLRPDTLKKILEYASGDRKMYAFILVKSLLGLAFILAAYQCSIPWVIMFFGAASVLGGVASFIVKKEVIVGIFDWMLKRPDKDIRLYGVIALAIGILMILAA